MIIRTIKKIEIILLLSVLQEECCWFLFPFCFKSYMAATFCLTLIFIMVLLSWSRSCQNDLIHSLSEKEKRNAGGEMGTKQLW